MQLFHSSNSDKLELNYISVSDKDFGDYIFASDLEQNNYGKNLFVIEVDEDEIIEASRLFYHDDSDKMSAIVSDFAEDFGITIEEAGQFIGEEENIFDYDDQSEIWNKLGLFDGEDALRFDWAKQNAQAKCAKALGFSIVAVQDENVISYMIDLNEYINDFILL